MAMTTSLVSLVRAFADRFGAKAKRVSDSVLDVVRAFLALLSSDLSKISSQAQKNIRYYMRV